MNDGTHTETREEAPARFRFAAADVKAAAAMSREGLRVLVKTYYDLQGTRKQTGNRLWADANGNTVIRFGGWMATIHHEIETLESQIVRLLKSYTRHHPVGRWMLSHRGVGPVLAAGLLAELDLTPWRCRHPGHDPADRCRPHAPLDHQEKGLGCGRYTIDAPGAFHAFAGLDGDPNRKWQKGQKRPFNLFLKTLCWNLATSFAKAVYGNDKKVDGRKNPPREDCFYGLRYLARKQYEVAKNERGEFAPAALRRLEEARARGRKVTAEQRQAWEAGRLQPLGLETMAKRWTAKLFLSHLHQVWYTTEFGVWPPPACGGGGTRVYAIDRLGHTHFIPPPNWPPADAGAD